MLKGVNKLKFSSRLKNESRRYTHMSTVDVCLLLFLSRTERSVFVCFSTDSPGQARRMALRRPGSWIGWVSFDFRAFAASSIEGRANGFKSPQKEINFYCARCCCLWGRFQLKEIHRYPSRNSNSIILVCACRCWARDC